MNFGQLQVWFYHINEGFPYVGDGFFGKSRFCWFVCDYDSSELGKSILGLTLLDRDRDHKIKVKISPSDVYAEYPYPPDKFLTVWRFKPGKTFLEIE